MMEREISDLETDTDLQNLKYYADSLIEKGYEVQIELGYGNPAKEIPKLVKKFAADILIMGEHGIAA